MKPTQIIIVRHGNTFDAHETPRRIGSRTDIPLSSSGLAQAQGLANFMVDSQLYVDRIVTSPLKRTYQTARILQEKIKPELNIHCDTRFIEIDYGPDENKTEEEVIDRIGLEALEQWDKYALVPPGWIVDPSEIINTWQNFAQETLHQFQGQTSLVVTSNGCARFVPELFEHPDAFKERNSIKIKTASLSILQYSPKLQCWEVILWNFRP